MLRIIAVSAHLQQYFGTDIFVKARGIGIVVSGTWFFSRWNQHLIDNLASKHKIDQPRVVAFDRLVSLVLYFLAATCTADIVGFALRSLLAVGGISGDLMNFSRANSKLLEASFYLHNQDIFLVDKITAQVV
ncbi:hypothetical protein KC19_11G072800 [Ceratodon purpureus]|uniref:Uncharacterized protein n=1 Tax=Ceratodon purpureus TaxID=3225 RepID=A0A8T0GEX6_CERPU|nr:hypothetical protein KC19_11G072800 [Ceratodon purpureus]